MSINYKILPVHLRHEARQYIETGARLYGFHASVVCNDLHGAYVQGGDADRRGIGRAITFWWTEAPAKSSGSPKQMEQWMAARAKERSK